MEHVNSPTTTDSGQIVRDADRCYRAVQGRDRRFDGVFYTGVRTTGIYCRPSCPAITPQRKNVTFFVTAAAAQGAGFRACRRCRPDLTPGSPEWYTMVPEWFLVDGANEIGLYALSGTPADPVLTPIPLD